MVTAWLATKHEEKDRRNQITSKNENEQGKEVQELEKFKESLQFTANTKAHQDRDIDSKDSPLPDPLQLLRPHKET